MFNRKKWNVLDIKISDEILEICGNNKVLATLLINRGINTKNKIQKFINPLKSPLSMPDIFSDMEKAVKRIKQAIESKENITVYGDFDADGITSTAVIYLTLKELGANVSCYLPDRESESHGLNTKALINLISKKKSRLIITVDCGISNFTEVNFAKGFKTDIIITDHHEAPEKIPEAYAVINPKSPYSTKDDTDIEELESLNYLAGAGVAFKLACKLLDEYNKYDFVNEIIPLTAIGTIGDVVELIGENRTLVQMGLELIRAGKHKGIQTLLKSAGIKDITKLTAENIAYSVVPRLNAAGRLESPYTALSVLISQDIDEIQSAVNKLNDLNKLRQDLCDKTFLQAKSMYEKDKTNNKKSIILYSPDWHIGIIGIAASKLTETFNKPVFLMTQDSINTNIIRCSCRSIPQVNIHAVLSEHKDLFEGFGGHKMAAGFSFDSNKIKFDDFKALITKTIDEYTYDIDISTSTINADMIIEPEDITLQTVESLSILEPYGAGNPPPLFISDNLTLKSFKFVGQNNNHVKLLLSKNNINLDCVMWNQPDFNIPLNTNLNILYTPSLNTFNNETNIQIVLNDIFSEYLENNKNCPDIKILDHRNKKNIITQVLEYINTTKKSTGIYLNSTNLKNKLNLPENIQNKIFNSKETTTAKEQIMFFDCPESLINFVKIIKESEAKTVHLMNFDINPINEENLISKLSGMLKYTLTHLNGDFDIQRAANALSVDTDTVDCALTLFENVNMTQFERINEYNCKILNISPVELSKIKSDDLYFELSERISNINQFRDYYINSPIENIKSDIDNELKLV